MGCDSCGTTSGGAPKGCKSNGHCATGGCNKLNVYDWLSDMEKPANHKPLNIFEIRFKGSKKLFYRNPNNIELFTGDAVIVNDETGYDLGHVSLGGELVRLQLKKYNIDPEANELQYIQRIANERDIEKYNELKHRESATLETARTMALELNLQMKLSDIEYRADGKKVVFYYTAEDRVDFRALIKKYADLFKVRIEMRQVGYRQEAARLGGIGSCGRELCCSTWLTDFKVVNISAARYQNLSINMLKLSGQCGRLKCCLNYELDTYMDALADFPKNDENYIQTSSGKGKLQKTDILKKMLWYAYEGKSDWVMMKLEDAKIIIQKNKEGIIPEDAIITKGNVEIEKYKEEDVINSSDLDRLKNREKKGKPQHKKNFKKSINKPAISAENTAVKSEIKSQNPNPNGNPNPNKKRYKPNNRPNKKPNENT